MDRSLRQKISKLGWFVLILMLFPAVANAVRIKDITDIEGVRTNQLVGYGLVVGLDGTGDGTKAEFTLQSMASMLDRMGISVDSDDMSFGRIIPANAIYCCSLLMVISRFPNIFRFPLGRTSVTLAVIEAANSPLLFVVPVPANVLLVDPVTLPKGVKPLPVGNDAEFSSPRSCVILADMDEVLDVFVSAAFDALDDSTMLMVTMSPILLALGSINNSPK